MKFMWSGRRGWYQRTFMVKTKEKVRQFKALKKWEQQSQAQPTWIKRKYFSHKSCVDKRECHKEYYQQYYHRKIKPLRTPKNKTCSICETTIPEERISSHYKTCSDACHQLHWKIVERKNRVKHHNRKRNLFLNEVKLREQSGLVQHTGLLV